MNKNKIDITLPGRYIENGNLHPISYTINYIENFFIKLGFKLIHGVEIEQIYYNFTALNIPKNHPTQTSKDTFWLNKKLLLRTHTSSVQIHAMETLKPPIKIITSGRVYRNDNDLTHTPMFHQIEGLIIDTNVNFIYLKKLLFNLINKFFNKNIKKRFRPSYFPFTQPSGEIDIINKNGKWIEILGCGIVHKNILENLNINSNIYTGLAFGIGIERLTMLKYNIKNIKIFFENDINFLKQFK